MSNQEANQPNQEPKNQTANIEDLQVDDAMQDEIKGGLLPAVQKVREAL